MRLTYHQSSTGIGAEMSVSWTRDLISSNSFVDELLALVEPGVGVVVLGLEVGDRVGVVAVAEPLERILDVAGRAVMDVGDMFGAWFDHLPRVRVVAAR